MTPEVVYPNAPITEAILDIRVTPRAATPNLLDQLAEFIKSHRAEYPEVIEQVVGTTSVTMERDLPPRALAEAVKNGFVAFSPSRTRAVQARLDGFSASKLAPYTDWHDLRTQARNLWAKYRKATDPVLITRLALRYINRIDIPLPISDLKEYMRTTPEISLDLPQQMSSFLCNCTSLSRIWRSCVF